MALGALTTITDVLRRPDMATLGPSRFAASSGTGMPAAERSVPAGPGKCILLTF